MSEKVTDIMPRVIEHNEKQRDYYRRQAEDTERTLARLSIIASGQLMLPIEEGLQDGTQETSN